MTHLSLLAAQAFFQDRDGAFALSLQPIRDEVAPSFQVQGH